MPSLTLCPQNQKTSVSCVGNRGLQAKGTQEIINRILSVLDEVDICAGLVVSLILVRGCAYYIWKKIFS
jgi:hypothetical protein